jgi:hypothetical protein
MLALNKLGLTTVLGLFSSPMRLWIWGHNLGVGEIQMIIMSHLVIVRCFSNCYVIISNQFLLT